MKYIIIGFATVALLTTQGVASAKLSNTGQCNISPYSCVAHNQHSVKKAKYKKYRARSTKKVKRHRVSRRSYAFAKKRAATGRRIFIFDPRRLSWAAYDTKGNLVKTGAASGGKGYCPDVKRRCLTPRGTFRVYRKGSSRCKSSKFPLGRGGAPMPHCMFFYGGYAIHGSPNVPGYNASHGCIRVRPPAARWLHRNFVRHGTTVIVRPYGSNRKKSYRRKTRRT